MLNNLQSILKEKITHVLNLSSHIHFDVSTPPNTAWGHFSTNVALTLSKELKKSPLIIAEDIVKKIKTLDFICEVKTVKGFINFFVHDEFIFNYILELLDNPDAFTFKKKDSLVNIEFVSANPTGPLHIGHGRWAALGDSLARLLKHIGYTVCREFYVNDGGVQIEKLKESVEALRQNKPIPKDGYQGDYLFDAIKSDKDPQDFFLDMHKELLKEMGVVFDQFYSEQTLKDEKKVEQGIEILDKAGYIYKKEGALWFKSSELGDDKDRVIIKSDGTYAYIAPDIAYHMTKIQRGAIWIIDILGADHHGYVKRIAASVKAMTNDSVRFDVLLGQLVNLFRNGEPIKMSKRAGNIITLKEVLDEIGKDALRFMLVFNKISQPIDFDLETVKMKSKDNPIFYIQYAFARGSSVLDMIERDRPSILQEKLKLNSHSVELCIFISQFNKIVYQSAMQLEVHSLARYLFDLAILFHSFYESNRIINHGKISQINLTILKVTLQVFEIGLNLLGITPSKNM